MGGFFSLDSGFMRAMSRIADLIILNVIYLVTCLPVVTIGAAGTAMYTVCFRLGTEREGSPVKDYFRAFRDEFRQATLIWLFLLLFGAASCVNIFIFLGTSGWMHYLFFLFVLFLVVVLMMAGYAFPLLSQFRNDTKSVIRNALIFSVAYLPRTALIVVINVFPWALLLTNPYLFLQAGFIWVVVYFAAAAYINTRLLKKVFAPYMEPEEEEK
ncbi:MAG TPA: hypothetical protein DDY81_00275 [Clostridiales bacterium]|nr:hypothetical protein [Clostridiales bacterium]